MRNKHLWIDLSFFTGLAATILGAFIQIMHWGGAELFLIPGLIATLLFIVIAIREVLSSPKIGSRQKTIWIIAFLFFTTVAGLVYMLSGRKNIISYS